MKSFRLSLSFPSGAVLIGGYSAVPDGLHAVHAQDQHGRPVIPATALRGALRETLESLLRGAGEPACCGGDGLSPGQDATTGVPCSLDATGRCKACLLFGTQRTSVDPGERGFSGLVLGEAMLEKDSDVGWSRRPGVGISRKTRSAENNRLFFQRVPMVSDAQFIAMGRLLRPELENLLVAAVENTTHVGAGRSRGLARVVIKLDWIDVPAASIGEFPAAGDVRVKVTLLSPASLGVPVVEENLRDTRHEIPGATLRGAIGFALAEALPEPNDEAFQALVSTDGAHFGYLFPCSSRVDGVSGPLPLTAAACKHHKAKHGVVDTLLDRLATAHVTTVEQIEHVKSSRLANCECGGPLHGISGARDCSTNTLMTRTVTRVAMDRTRQSARDQNLFSQVLLEAGAVFEGTIRNIPASGRARLEQALSLPLSLGRGRASGWGRVGIEVLPPRLLPTVESRGKAFDRALSAHLESCRLPLNRVGHLVPISLLSPLLSGHGQDPELADGAELLVQALQAQGCLVRARRFSREGGWDQRLGKMQPALATAAGGVFVIDLGQRTWTDMIPTMEALEKEGVGHSKHQGYGQVLCFDPFFLSRTFAR